MRALRIGVGSAEIRVRDPRWPPASPDRFRATALVLDHGTRVCVVSCATIRLQQSFLEPLSRQMAERLGLPAENIVIAANHTHYGPDLRAEDLAEAIMASAFAALEELEASEPVTLHFCLGSESTVGQNSRVIVPAASPDERPLILWTPLNPQHAFERPTGPFDPELPALAFRDPRGKLRACLFNHSTHNIGRRDGAEFSPGFYEMAAQALERELGGTFLFLPGASGSTHNMALGHEELAWRISRAVREALDAASEVPVDRLRSLRWDFAWRVRCFDEDEQEQAVTEYCRRMRGGDTETVADFRARRQALAPHQVEGRLSPLQCFLIGDIAFVAVPADFFTGLGLRIKRRSPFRHTFIVGYANGYEGYIPDRDAYALGGYQTWVGPCQCEAGTGEALVDEVISTLNRLWRENHTEETHG